MRLWCHRTPAVSASGSTCARFHDPTCVVVQSCFNLGFSTPRSQARCVIANRCGRGCRYYSERYSRPRDGDVAFDLPIPEEGSYRLRLHFVDMYNSEPGSRLFDVVVQGVTAWESLDIVREVGTNTAMVIRCVLFLAKKRFLMPVATTRQCGGFPNRRGRDHRSPQQFVFISLITFSVLASAFSLSHVSL